MLTITIATLAACSASEPSSSTAPAPLQCTQWSAMLDDVRGRIRRTALLAGEASALEKAKLLAAIMIDAFDVRSELALDHAQLVADLVSDRAQLRQLDHLVALWIAEAVTGKRGPRAFRE